MYRTEDKTQLSFEDFYLPFGGKLNPNNRWVQLADLIPWEDLEAEYASQFAIESGQGAPAIQFRTALGALIIKEKLGITDEETVEQIRETPYLQYLIGMQGYQDEAPFDPSMPGHSLRSLPGRASGMVHFRKRISMDMITHANELIIPKNVKKTEDDTEAEKEENPEVENSGKLLIDATCVPGDIRYPTDLSLLNESREKLETIIDVLHAKRPKGATKPRTYRQKARKDFLAVIKKRRASKNKMRKAIRKQLGYIRRNLRHIEQLAAGVGLKSLSRKQYRNMLVISEVFRQQALMYESKDHRISGRIVSISQPHIRPIVRGKAGTPVEFGMKISSANIDGYMFIDRCSWDPYNESGDLVMQAEKYRHRYGVYPESIHADQIYRTRGNRNWCKERGIRLSGPPLGRPPKDRGENRERKKLARQDELDRIAVEGTFGRAKRRYSMGRLMTKLAETSESQVAMIMLVMNLEKIRKDLFYVFIIAIRRSRKIPKSHFPVVLGYGNMAA
ncbi:IS5 family transposase [Salinispira pacifica]|uniref:IS5 family transposase n=1 Tax=Salinispira pacifica TaxID=1307761 RepID=UPI003CC70D76